MSDNLPAVHPLSRPVNWGEPLLKEGDFLLPVGTVTLLLADVEGSTRLWETEPDAMRDAITRLDDLVSEVIGRHDGVRPLEQGGEPRLAWVSGDEGIDLEGILSEARPTPDGSEHG